MGAPVTEFLCELRALLFSETALHQSGRQPRGMLIGVSEPLHAHATNRSNLAGLSRVEVSVPARYTVGCHFVKSAELPRFPGQDEVVRSSLILDAVLAADQLCNPKARRMGLSSDIL